MWPLFTNIAFLTGLAGVTVPVLIHLLLKRKSQRLRFSTIQFFVKRDEQSMRKRKLRNLLLLAARVVLFALIVFAFARPYLPIGGAGAAGARHEQVVLVLDTTASMLASASGGPQWTRAKEMARKVLANLKADDRAALISCSSRSSVVSPFAPPSVVAQKLADLAPTYGSGELADGLQQALKVAAVGNPAYSTTFYVVSDLQRNGAQNLASIPLPSEIPVKILDLGDRFIPNVAITDLQLTAENQSEAHAVINSFSDENYSGLRIQFKMDGKEVFSRQMPLQAGASTNIPLAIPALAPGWHNAEFAIEPKDRFAADDVRYASIFVPERIHCLVVETRKTPRVYQEETFFVTTALDPVHGTSFVSPSKFVFEKAGMESLASKLRPQPGQPKIELVLLPGVKQIPSEALAALTSFVQDGGGLMLFLNDGVSANYYNTELAALLPAKLDKVEAMLENARPWRIAEFNKTSPVFGTFRDPTRGNLSIPDFTKRFKLAAGPESSVAAAFDDGVPVVLERKIGRGKVMLVNTSADTAWTDWPKHKTFVPWLHASGYELAGRARYETEVAPTFVSGSDVEFELGTKKQPVKLQRNTGGEWNLTTDDQGRLRDVTLETPGIYVLKDDSGKEMRRLAVNLPVSESEISSMTPADFQQQLVLRSEPMPKTAGLFGDPGHGKELWRLLLLGALALMLVEPLVANRTFA